MKMLSKRKHYNMFIMYGTEHSDHKDIEDAEARINLGALESDIKADDDVVVSNACWCLSLMSDKPDGAADIEATLCSDLRELIMHKSPSISIPCLHTVGNIVAFANARKRRSIKLTALPYYLFILINEERDQSIKKKACWTLSKITAGDAYQIKHVISANIIGALVRLCQIAETDIKEEAALAISNATSGGTHDQIKFLTRAGCIQILCDLLGSPKPLIITHCLDSLRNILKVGEAEKTELEADDTTVRVNFYARLMNKAEGWKKIKELQCHQNSEIHKKAMDILEIYTFDEEDDPVLVAAPHPGSFDELHAMIMEHCGPSQQTGFAFLPIEIKRSILTYCSAQDLERIMYIDFETQPIITDPIFWGEHFRRSLSEIQLLTCIRDSHISVYTYKHDKLSVNNRAIDVEGHIYWLSNEINGLACVFCNKTTQCCYMIDLNSFRLSPLPVGKVDGSLVIPMSGIGLGYDRLKDVHKVFRILYVMNSEFLRCEVLEVENPKKGWRYVGKIKEEIMPFTTPIYFEEALHWLCKPSKAKSNVCVFRLLKIDVLTNNFMIIEPHQESSLPLCGCMSTYNITKRDDQIIITHSCEFSRFLDIWVIKDYGKCIWKKLDGIDFKPLPCSTEIDPIGFYDSKFIFCCNLGLYAFDLFRKRFFKLSDERPTDDLRLFK